MHAFTNRLLWLNLTSKWSLENMIWLWPLKLWGHFSSIFFIFLVSLQVYVMFCIFFVSPESSSPVWSKWIWDHLFIAPPCVLLARSAHQFQRPVCGWIEEARSRDKNRSRSSHYSKMEPGPLAPQSASWDHGGHYWKCDHLPSLLSGLGVYALLSAFNFSSFCVQSLPFNQQTLPAHYKAHFGLQNLSVPELVSMRFLFLYFQMFCFLCVQLLKNLAK